MKECHEAGSSKGNSEREEGFLNCEVLALISLNWRT